MSKGFCLFLEYHSALFCVFSAEGQKRSRIKNRKLKLCSIQFCSTQVCITKIGTF